MSEQIRAVGGSAYRGKDPIDHVFVEKQSRDLVVGQRDHAERSRASIAIGKVVERVPATDYFDFNVWLDTQFPHVTFIAGKRGSGKSYDLGIILEGLHASNANFALQPQNFASILFDLQSQFWSLGQPLRADLKPDAEQQAAISKWNLVGEVKKPRLYLPSGGNPIYGNETPFTIPPRALELPDWLALLETARFEPMGQLIASCLQVVVPGNPDFDISDLIRVLKQPSAYPELASFAGATIDGVLWRLAALENTKLFEKGPLVTDTMLRKNECSIVLMRELPEDLKAVTVAVLMRQVERIMSRFHQQKKIAMRQGKSDSDDRPSRVWVLIDEAHLICPASGKTSANEVIIDYVKRGRDAGLSLVMATQQPSAIDTAAISQVDVTILHKLTIDADISAATARLPAPLPQSVRARDKDISDPRVLIRELLPGEALLSDAEASRSFIVRMRPRVSPHGGGEPLL